MSLQFLSGLCPVAPTVFPGKRGHLQRKILEVRNHACHRFENLISLKYLLPSFLWFYLFLCEHFCRTHAGDALQESTPGRDEGVCVGKVSPCWFLHNSWSRSPSCMAELSVVKWWGPSRWEPLQGREHIWQGCGQIPGLLMNGELWTVASALTDRSGLGKKA